MNPRWRLVFGGGLIVLACVRLGRAGPARTSPAQRVPGNVELATGAATDSGGVFVYEVTEGSPWGHDLRASLRVLRYAWPR